MIKIEIIKIEKEGMSPFFVAIGPYYADLTSEEVLMVVANYLINDSIHCYLKSEEEWLQRFPKNPLNDLRKELR